MVSVRFQDISSYLQRYFIGILRFDDEQDSVVLTGERKAMIRTEEQSITGGGSLETCHFYKVPLNLDLNHH